MKMKQFNLEEYLRLKEAGNEPKLVTRIGRSARIVCTDVKGTEYSILALVIIEGEEYARFFTKNGRSVSDEDDNVSDLFFAELEEESTYRPYKNAEEFLEAQDEHGMYLHFASNCVYKLVTGINRGSIAILWDSKQVEEIGYADLFKRATWRDGSPCGVKEK